ncbi:Uncharacterized protein Adt_47396 [Abeliophyllum distichum]|uniref:Uncharacterized protein n=2 Tax=Abeliophyllum distichum TaxID=126358 RepID=A0ABD1NVQ7_9LAMI
MGNKEAAEASKVIEVDDAPEAEVPLSRKRKAKSSGTGASQATASIVEIADSYTTCSVPPSKGCWLSTRRERWSLRVPPNRPRLRKTGMEGPMTPRDGSEKYFTPKWEEFSSHGELEDVLEASLASAIRASAMQMKVLGEFRTRMQEQRKLVAQASRADKEHKQAIEGLQATLDSARIAYKQMEADMKESDSNLLNMTKQLDNANAAQKVAAEGLEAANKEKRRLLEKARSRDEEISVLRKDLANAEDGKNEAEAGKREVKARLANAEADFVANFHNTEAYTNFSDYFARVGQQEVLTELRNDHPDFDVKSLEVRFPPPDAGSEEDS